MARIFISYRRADSQAITGRIYDRLTQAFGRGNVFKDVDLITPGSTFTEVLAQELSRCDTMLVIIGSEWLSITAERGQRRLDNPEDWVRMEVATALQRADMRVIPVLVDGADMPPPDELPPDLRALALRQAVVVRHDPDFHRDMNRLVSQIARPFPWQRLVIGAAALLAVVIGAAAVLTGPLSPGAAPTPAVTAPVENTAAPTATATPPPIPTETPAPTLDPNVPRPWNVGDTLYLTGSTIVYNAAGGGEISHELDAGAAVVVVRRRDATSEYQYQIGGQWWWHIGDAPNGLRPGWVPQSALADTPPAGTE